MTQMPYRLNPYEQNVLEAIQRGLQVGGPSFAETALSLYQPMISGAIERRQTNLASRREGLMGLRDQAMQLAQQGAAPNALADYVAHQATELPLMNNKRGAARLGGLMDFVGGLYDPGSEVSGLAPPDVRAAFGGGPMGLDDEDKAAVGGLVLQAYQKGLPFRDIRESVRQSLIAAGYDEQKITDGIRQAESSYEQLTGVPLGDMRDLGDQLRNYQEHGTLQDLPSWLGDAGMTGLEDTLSPMVTNETDVTSLLGQLAQNPAMFQQIAQAVSNMPRQQEQGFHLSDWLGNWDNWLPDFSFGSGFPSGPNAGPMANRTLSQYGG